METFPTVNLVKSRKPHVLDIFLRWALTIGRGLVIVTELAALGAFLLRFGLDRQLVDLHDKIIQEQNIVRFLKNNEDTYRNAQTRLDLTHAILTSDDQFIKTFANITNAIPQEMVLSSFIYTPNTIHIDGTIRSIDSLNTFTNILKQYPGVTSVSLDKIENKTSVGTIAISLTITFQKGQTPVL